MCEHCPPEGLDEVTDARLKRAIELAEENARRLTQAEQRQKRIMALFFPEEQRPSLKLVPGRDDA